MEGRTSNIAIFAAVLSISMMLLLQVPAGTSQTTSRQVKEGDPLHLYVTRSVTQDMTFLYYHAPLDPNGNISADARYRHSFGEKGSDTDSLVMFFPQDKDSNFLQFQPNMTLTAHYDITLSAVTPADTSDLGFDLKVTIELDLERDGEYDHTVTFHITGTADSSRTTHTGDMAMDPSDLEPFDGEKGGRIRVTITREDDIDTSVVMYCGYQGKTSSIWLPYSKFTYVPQDDDGDDGSYVWLVVLAIAVFIAIIVVALISGRDKEKKDAGGKGKKDARKDRRRSRR